LVLEHARTTLAITNTPMKQRRQSDVYGGALGSRACTNHTYYYEHPNEAERIACGKVHMTYDEVKDYGFFKKTVPCSETCRTDG
jgi:hypothetical protein